MRVWRCRKRLAKKLCHPASWRLQEWMRSVAVGDYIATCDGCNRKVAGIEYLVRRWRGHKVISHLKIMDEILFTDSRGHWHHFPGGGCAYPVEDRETVISYFRELTHDAELMNSFDTNGRLTSIKDALDSGVSIVDDYGELLPEFEAS